MKATQLKLEPITKAAKATKPQLFRRAGSQFWQARFIFAGILHRRTTGTANKTTAWTIANLWRKQIARRGKPTKTHCQMDQ